MAMKEFVVTRYAVRPDGTMTVPVSTHETKDPALKDFFQKCGTACDSDYMTDAVVLSTYQGFVLRSEFSTTGIGSSRLNPNQKQKND